jgi:CheY-like chemotaxis protein
VAKVLLVEDDNNLREIYQARLMAEGYDIVTAQNGEEALVVAKQNKPDLIISDVMMPRISGFEMLDILRNTNELKNTKVIMLTALGQDDDQKRASNLGANKYLVKSQVTLEDIVNAAKELLNEDESVAAAQMQSSVSQEPLPPSMVAPAAPSIPAIAHIPDPTPPPATVAQAPQVAPAPAVPAPAAPANPAPTAVVPPVVAAPIVAPPIAAPMPVPAPAPAPAAVTPVGPPATPLPATAPTPPVAPAPDTAAPTAAADSAAQGLEAEEAALQAQIANYAKDSVVPDPAVTASNDQAIAAAVEQLNTAASGPVAATPATAPEAPAPEVAPEPAATNSNNVTVAGKKIIQPISDPATKPDLNALLAKEEARNPGPAAPPIAGSTAVSQPPASGAAGQAFDPNTSL